MEEEDFSLEQPIQDSSPVPELDILAMPVEENLIFVQRALALGISVLFILSLIYFGFILIGKDGLVTYRPSNSAI
ncbi:MAG: hypothetical protein HOJ60_02585, partial [Euryarchaeota archaeon]|nr:hypothetical protein [Euryarchaeota archaeon]